MRAIKSKKREKANCNKIIALCGNKDSYLVSHSDWFLNSFVEKEACPNNLAPTTSTTAQLVLGDALAVCLLQSRNFSDKDFARFHPGGSLGKRLYLKMSDLCNSDHMPRVDIDDSMYDVIVEISRKRLGASVAMSDQEIVGIITDGDIMGALYVSDPKFNVDIFLGNLYFATVDPPVPNF